MVARNPSIISESYDNIITGTAVIWNNKTQKLEVRNDTQPLADDFTGRITDNVIFNRNSDANDQLADIFRVGDFLKYPNQVDDEARFLEIKAITYANGITYVSDNTSKNSSTVSKYVTKEVVINNPATAIDVHLTLNSKDINDVQVLYKFKKSSSQENFEDVNWTYFNEDGSPDSLVIATPENTISSIVEKQSSYQDITYSVSNLPEFSSFAVKIIMKGVDPSFVPKIQDIRAVAAF